MAKLIVLAGLPATGKSTIAREIARRTGAVWLRVDSMDQAIWNSGTAPEDLHDWSYRAAQAIAEDNLRLAHDVVADCVNDLAITRTGWRNAGLRAGAEILEVEVVCMDTDEHRKRVEIRETEIPDLVLPRWETISSLKFEAWDRDHLTIDTAAHSVDACVEQILAVRG